MSFLTTTLTLFLIIDAFGNLSAYQNLVAGLDSKRQRHVVIREMLIALFILITAHYFGEFILAVIDVDQTTVQLSGGLILFLIAIRMIFPKENDTAHAHIGEPFIVPIATPMIAGPSAIATVMIYAYNEEDPFKVVGAILLAWGLSALALAFSRHIKHAIGDKTLVAIERLMGLILTMLSVEMLLKGIQLYLHTAH